MNVEQNELELRVRVLEHTQPRWANVKGPGYNELMDPEELYDEGIDGARYDRVCHNLEYASITDTETPNGHAFVMPGNIGVRVERREIGLHGENSKRTVPDSRFSHKFHYFQLTDETISVRITYAARDHAGVDQLIQLLHTGTSREEERTWERDDEYAFNQELSRWDAIRQ
jgi:hypothetical protein